MSDRITEKLRHEYMASHGIVSIALDFRSGNERPLSGLGAGHQLRGALGQAHARELKTRPDLIGLSGQSSGGHLAMLVAMRPHDPRYAAIPLPAGSPAHDATVRCVVMSWPVINPLGRYRHAKRAQAAPNPPEWPKRHHRAPGFLLAERSQHGGGQSDAGARARREGADCRRRSGSRAAATRCTTTRTRIRASPATSRSASSPTTARPAATSRSNYIEMERHAGHSPDLTKTGDMFERMVAFVGKHVKA